MQTVHSAPCSINHTIIFTLHNCNTHYALTCVARAPGEVQIFILDGGAPPHVRTACARSPMVLYRPCIVSLKEIEEDNTTNAATDLRK